MNFTPTPAFIVSLLPLPFLIYLNVVVARLLVQLKRQAKGKNLRYPKVYHQGRALGVLSACFAMLPAIVEWRIFVLNPLWSISYLVGGVLGVLALRMVRRGLEQELRQLSRPTPRPSRRKK